MVTADGKIWLPPDDELLLARVCAVAHQGHHGHVDGSETTRRIGTCFCLKGIRDKIKGWVDRCLQCIKLRGGNTIPRPLGTQLLAERPFEVILLDFIKLPLDRSGKYCWALLITDQLTRLAVVVPAANCVAELAAPIFVER